MQIVVCPLLVEFALATTEAAGAPEVFVSSVWAAPVDRASRDRVGTILAALLSKSRPSFPR